MSRRGGGGGNDMVAILMERLDDMQAQVDHQTREMKNERAARAAFARDVNDSINTFAEPLDGDRSEVASMQRRLQAQATEIHHLQADAKEQAEATRVIMEMLEDTMPIQDTHELLQTLETKLQKELHDQLEEVAVELTKVDEKHNTQAAETLGSIERAAIQSENQLEEVREQFTTDTGAIVAQVLQAERDQQNAAGEFEAFKEESVLAHQDLEAKALNLLESLKLQQVEMADEQARTKQRLEVQIVGDLEDARKGLSASVQDLGARIQSVDELVRSHAARTDADFVRTNSRLDDTSQIAERVDSRVARWDSEVNEAALQTESKLFGLREGLDVFRDEMHLFVLKHDDDRERDNAAVAESVKRMGLLSERVESVQSSWEQQLRDSASESRSQNDEARNRIQQAESGLNRLQMSHEQTIQDVQGNKQRLDKFGSTIHELGRDITQCSADLTHSIDAVAQFRQDVQHSIDELDDRMDSAGDRIAEFETTLDGRIAERTDSRFSGVDQHVTERHEQVVSMLASRRDEVSSDRSTVAKEMDAIVGNLDTLARQVAENKTKVLADQATLQTHVETTVASQDERFKSKTDSIREIVSSAREDTETLLSESIRQEGERIAAAEARTHGLVKKSRDVLDQQLQDLASGHASRFSRLESEMNSRFMSVTESLEGQIKLGADRAKSAVSKLEEDSSKQISKSAADIEQQLADSKTRLGYELDRLGSLHTDDLQRTQTVIEQQIADSTHASESRLYRIEATLH
eukprot:SAG22_NODE_2096_length_3019_cov_1.872603_1_plen_750_part_10